MPGAYVSFINTQGGSLVKWYRDPFAAWRPQSQARGEAVYEALFFRAPRRVSGVSSCPTSPDRAAAFISDSAGVLADSV